MNAGSTIRTALGSTASLGDLYDARTDDFCGISIFKKTVPESAKTESDSHFSDIHLVHSDDFSAKVSILDVNAELQVSVLTGLFQLEGSGRYLSDKKSSARTVKSSLIYNIKTKQESVNIYHQDLKDAFSIDAIESGMGTHVVVGISWGANSIVTCQYENRENRDIREIGGNVSAQLKKMSMSISGDGSADFNDGEAVAGMKFDVRMFGDILNQNEELPTTFQGAVSLMKRLPSLVAASNQGRGKPLSYRLVPISLLKGYLNISIKADQLLRKIDEAQLVRLVHLFDDLSRSQQKLHDFYQDVEEFGYCFRADDLEKIFTLKEEMSVEETSFRYELSTTVTSIRSGTCDMTCLEAAIQKFHLSNLSSQKICGIIGLWSDVMEKINFARPLVQNGAKFIGFGSFLEEVILNDFDSRLIILFFSKAAKTEDSERWGGNRQLFLQEMKKENEGDKYFVVDLDIHPNRIPKSGPSCVQIIRGGQLVVPDLLSELKRIAVIPFAQSTSGSARILTKPMRIAPFSTVCPGNTCNPNKVHEWVCSRCMEKLEYDLDKHVYCDCGKTLVTELEFKCNDQKHGLAFQKHDVTFLFKILTSMQTCEQLNILVLGGSGEDRHAWINGLANYFKYESFSDAATGRLSRLLPVDFRHQSNNQKVMAYQFLVGNICIRLIDNPQVDTVDDSNRRIPFEMSKYLKSISCLGELNAICILVNPDNLEEDDTLVDCISHLATFPDARVSKNILFCSVANKEDSSSPRETMLAVRSLVMDIGGAVNISVTQRTFYSYDDQAYLHLTAAKCNSTLKLSNELKIQMHNSWAKSNAECHRMLRQIQKTKPFILNLGPSLKSIQEKVEKYVGAITQAFRIVVAKVVEFELEATEMAWMRDRYINEVCDWSPPQKYTVEKALRSAISVRRKNAEIYRKGLDTLGKAFLFFNHVLTYPHPKIPYNDDVEHIFVEYILEEENKPGRGYITETIKILNGMKHWYEESKKFLYLPQFVGNDECRTNVVLGPAELSDLSASITEIFQELVKLEVCGEILWKTANERKIPKCSLYKSPLSYSEQVEAILNK